MLINRALIISIYFLYPFFFGDLKHSEEYQNPKTSFYNIQDSIPKFPCNDDSIPRYVAFRTSGSIQIDGVLDEPSWLAAPQSPDFRDLVTGAEAIHNTRAAVLWDDQFLYIAYWVEEPDVRATLTQRDAYIYKDNDIEFFIAGADSYYEFEINAFGTIYEVFFIWEDAYYNKGYEILGEWKHPQPGSKVFKGVGFKEHPRGYRIGFWKWDFPGLKSAVQVDGTINNRTDRDRGWTVEMALPWSGMTTLAQGDQRSLPPQNEDVWRMDFSRFNQYKEAPPAKDSGGWAWSPHMVWDSHVPECFTYVHFSEEVVE